MGYIDNNLMSGEKITYRAYLHWVVFLSPIIWPLIAVFVIAFLFFSGGGHDTPYLDVSFIVGGSSILIAIIHGIKVFITYKTSEFGVTNKRVLVKIGFISRKSLEVLLTKVEGIQVNQGLLGCILGYGSIAITGTGGSKNYFNKISSPLKFRSKVQEQIAIVQESK